MKVRSLAGATLLLVASSPFAVVARQESQKAAYLDPSLPVEKRAQDLVSRMTLEEKVSQMQNAAPAIPRLGIPEYDWWNEALHGVAFAPAWRLSSRRRSGSARPSTPTSSAGSSRPSFPTRRAPSTTRRMRQATTTGIYGPHVLVAEHQHLPRSALGREARRPTAKTRF